MRDLLTKNRIALNKELRTIDQRKRFSPSLYSIARVISPVFEKYLHGCFLDIGCGETPFRYIIEEHVERYFTLDIAQRTEKLDYVCDIQDMSIINDNSFDSSGCFCVLEHVPDPGKAAREIFRITKPGGTLVLTVPLLSRIHEEPYDYFRFTVYGLRYLFEEAGFTTQSISPAGGIFSFVGHQVSTLLVCSFWNIPIIRKIVLTMNFWFIVKTCVWLDIITGTKDVMPETYVAVFVKK